MVLFHSTPQRLMTMWDTPVFEHLPLGKLWRRMSNGDTSNLTHRAIPRHIHGYQETHHPNTQQHIRWFPYKKEMTVDGRLVPSFYDVLYTYYFPRELDDDERIKYVSLKTNRPEMDVAEELFLMRKMKLFAAQSLRNKLRGKQFRLPDGVDYSGVERNYLHGTVRIAQDFGASWYSNQFYESTLIYSPAYDFGDSLDMILTKQLRLSLEYMLCDISTNRAIPRCRLPTVKGECKYPLEGMEPCLWEAMKLRLAVMAVIAKQEGYVVDHDLDKGHKYSGCIMHMFPNSMDPSYIDNFCASEDLDLDLARKWLDHYQKNHLLPRKQQPAW